MTDTPLLALAGVEKRYRLRRSPFAAPLVVHAVNGVDLEVAPGETLGLVGESGCGKSTLARLVTRLEAPSAGAIRLDGTDIAQASGAALKRFRRRVQMVFQDPYASLNPRMTVGRIVREPLDNHAMGAPGDRPARVAALFERVGLPASTTGAYPHELSGGQRQRVAIARALAVGPDLVVADEPVSALDVSVQAQVLNLITDLQAEAGLALLFVSHDLSVVRHVSRRIAVMYLGAVVETADAATLFAAPRHPYTRALMAAAPPRHPRERRRRALLGGDLPSPTRLPPGCPFHARCPIAIPRCRDERPVLRPVGDGARAACHRADA